MAVVSTVFAVVYPAGSSPSSTLKVMFTENGGIQGAGQLVFPSLSVQLVAN